MKTFIIAFFSVLILGILAFVFFQSRNDQFLNNSSFKNTEDIQEVTFDISWPRAEEPRFIVFKKGDIEPFLINGKIIAIDEPSMKEVYRLDTQKQGELRTLYQDQKGSFISRGEGFTVTAKVKLTSPQAGTDYYSLTILEILDFYNQKGWCPEGYLC